MEETIPFTLCPDKYDAGALETVYIVIQSQQNTELTNDLHEALRP